MNESQIFQYMSQMVFNATAKGQTREKALEQAEETVSGIVDTSKKLASELDSEELGESQVFQYMSQLVFNDVMKGKDRETALRDAAKTVKAIATKTKALAAKAQPKE